MLSHGRAIHHRRDEHADRPRNIAVAGFPPTYSPTALDADKARKTLGAEAKGVTG